MSWDLFISHASEDKEEIARPLAALLESRGHKVWFDECELTLGDSLRQRIDQGLVQSRFGIVILSPSFFAKEWPRKELDGLVAREDSQQKVILPVWHGIDSTDVAKFSPLLAGRLAVSSTRGLAAIAVAIEAAMGVYPAKHTKSVGCDSPRVENTTIAFRKVIEEPNLLVQRRVGPYVVKDFVGAGGSGLVYRTFHTGTGNTACIKLLYPIQSGNKAILSTISRSIRALNSIDNPNIVKVMDTGEAKFNDCSSFYLVMNFITGAHLDHWSRNLEGCSDVVAKRLQMAFDLADSLFQAHEARYLDEVGVEARGLLHGDLKPTNILVTDTDTAIIIDFLLADIQRLLDPRIVPYRLLESEFESIPITAALGTPGFMALEQEREGIVTVKTDVYGLGMTFLHLFEPRSDHDRMVALYGKTDRKELECLIPMLHSMLDRNPNNRPADLNAVAGMINDAAEALGIYLQRSRSPSAERKTGTWETLSRILRRQ